MEQSKSTSVKIFKALASTAHTLPIFRFFFKKISENPGNLGLRIWF